MSVGTLYFYLKVSEGGIPRAMTGKEALNSLHFCSQTKFSPEVLIGLSFMVECHHRRLEVLLGYKQSISGQHIRTLAKLSKTTWSEIYSDWKNTSLSLKQQSFSCSNWRPVSVHFDILEDRYFLFSFVLSVGWPTQ